MAIPEELRTKTIVQPQSLADVKEAIKREVSTSPDGCATLRLLGIRFQAPARRFGGNARTLIDELAAEGAVALKYVPQLRRTFIISEKMWLMIREQELVDGPIIVWRNLANAWKDVR